MSGINVSYRGEGPNVTTGNGGGAAPLDVPKKIPNDANAGIGDSRAVAGDRIGRLMVDTGPVRSSVALNYGSSDQVLTQCTRWLFLSTQGTLVLRLADSTADETWILSVGWHQLAIALVRNSGSSGAVGKLCF